MNVTDFIISWLASILVAVVYALILKTFFDPPSWAVFGLSLIVFYIQIGSYKK